MKYFVLVTLLLCRSAFSEEAVISTAIAHLRSHKIEAIDSRSLVISKFAYDLDGDGEKELQVSEPCRFEKPCLKVVLSNRTKEILLHFEEYDFWPLEEAERINGYYPVLIIRWHGNMRYSPGVWVHGQPNFLACEEVSSYGLRWNAQERWCDQEARFRQ